MLLQIIILAVFAIIAMFIGPKDEPQRVVIRRKVIFAVKAVGCLIVGYLLLKNCDFSLLWLKVLYAAFAVYGAIATGKEYEMPSPSSIIGVTIAVMFIFPGWLTAVIGGICVLIAAKDFKGY